MTRSALRLAAELLGPLVLVGLVALVASHLSTSDQTDAINVLVIATIVIGLYVFIGNSGVISFGQISFAAVGAFAAGIYTTPLTTRQTTMPHLFGILARPELTNVESILLAAGIGALFALLVGLALMRLSGLAAGIATFAVLEITYDILANWDKIGPGPTTLASVPVTTGVGQATVGCAVAVVIAFVYQRSRSSRLLRASRADALAARGIGVSIVRHRLGAFVLSGAICGFAGALYVHALGSINVTEVYLTLTFLSLAMLVVGGSQSLWGATLGGVVLGILSSFLTNAVNGTTVFGFSFTLPNGLNTIIFAALFVGALMLFPRGLARNREFLEKWLGERPPRPGAVLGPPGGVGAVASAAAGHAGAPATAAKSHATAAAEPKP
ncbi:MAG: branched-chain amino acid ABC transporter permease [Actinomycetota bacterium]|nr:branched-chain amino acid ABC transporter permease [Actinomycetota bacterium]